MYYIRDAYYLLKYIFVSSYRHQTHARWKQAPTYRIAYEIGGGLIGLLILFSVASIIVFGLAH